MTFQPEGHCSRGSGVHRTVCPLDLLGSHPIKSTAFLGPCMPDALASPMLCSGKHDAQVPLRLSQDYCSG